MVEQPAGALRDSRLPEGGAAGDLYCCNATCNNFLPLGGEANRGKPMVALHILARVAKYRPGKLPRVLPWMVGAAIDPMKHIFNEPFRRLSRAQRAAIERPSETRPSPRTTNWVPTESLRAQP